MKKKSFIKDGKGKKINFQLRTHFFSFDHLLLLLFLAQYESNTKYPQQTSANTNYTSLSFEIFSRNCIDTTSAKNGPLKIPSKANFQNKYLNYESKKKKGEVLQKKLARMKFECFSNRTE